MIVLDENIFESQRLQLKSWRVHLRQIGVDAGRKGMPDDEVVRLLREIHRPTFFTRDRDFYNRRLRSEEFCLVYLDLLPLDVARYARRLLRHPEFKMWSQRKGCVARASASGISVWRIHAARVARYRWVD